MNKMKLDLTAKYKTCSKGHQIYKTNWQTYRVGYGGVIHEIGYYCPKCRILFVTNRNTTIQDVTEL